MAIRPPTSEDLPAFLDAVKRSRFLHHPWVAPPNTRAQYRRYLDRIASGNNFGFLIVLRPTADIVGVINLNNVIRDAFQNAFLGYYGFLPHARQGLMSDGLQLVLWHAFRKLRLHRLEANIQPGNKASIALVKKCGFVKEGFSRRYLKVCGHWVDHERWAILSEDFVGRKTRTKLAKQPELRPWERRSPRRHFANRWRRDSAFLLQLVR